MIENIITHYRSKEGTYLTNISELKSMIADYHRILLELETAYKKQSFFNRLFDFKSQSEISDIKNFIEEKEILMRKSLNSLHREKKKVLDEYASYLMNVDGKDDLIKLASIQNSINSLYDVVAKTKKSGDYALSEIDSAISSISSAETMETLDMFTSNKAISFISTTSNYDAKSSIDDASSAIIKFKTNLESMKLKVEEIKETSSIESLDFFFDMFFDNSAFDLIGGFMVLDALGNAKDELFSAREKVASVMNELVNKEYQEIQKRKLDHDNLFDNFKKSFQIKAKSELTALKIEI